MEQAHLTRIKQERHELLNHITRLTDKAMIALAFVWIGLMIADFLGKLTHPLLMLNNVIWGIFIVDFVIKFSIAPHKKSFLRTHWIILLSLILPAFRILRIFQALRALQALSLLRILTSLNRTMGALIVIMGRRGIGYVFALTILVLFAGAAGMYYFENPQQLRSQGFADVANQGGGLTSYSEAVWWTAMLMTTIASEYWPVTAMGRMLCFLISIFSLGVFGYITATLASFFVDTDKKEPEPKSGSELAALRAEIQALREELRQYGRD